MAGEIGSRPICRISLYTVERITRHCCIGSSFIVAGGDVLTKLYKLADRTGTLESVNNVDDHFHALAASTWSRFPEAATS